MDKVELIKAEVERMHNLLPIVDGDNISLNYADRICTTLEMYIDSLQEEPVLHQVKGKEPEGALKELLDNIDEAELDATRKEMMKEEPVNKNYEKAAKEYRKFREECGVKDPVSLNEIEEAYYLGMETLKEQMMEDAIEREVKIDAGGYPYIPQIELYDYEENIPLAKEGDKVKVVIMKGG